MSFVCHYCLVLTFYSNNRISVIFAETVFFHFSQHFTFVKTASICNKTISGLSFVFSDIHELGSEVCSVFGQ